MDKIDLILNEVNGVISYNDGVYDIEITNVSKENDLLKVEATAKIDGEVVKLDTPFFYRNPPILIPDGTTSKVEVTMPFGGSVVRDEKNYKQDPLGALKEIVSQTIKDTTK